MAGRLDAVAGVPGNPKIIYLAHSSGGLWKSTDGGTTFASAFEVAHSSAVGAIAVDPRDPNVLYVGTGEAFPRNTAVAGDGIYRSPDAGKTWRHLGLEDSGSIAKIAIDPADDRIVLAAAIGHEFAPSEERGIFRSTDAGAHWRRVLYVNPTTGGSDIAFDPKHPNVVWAGTFDFLRQPWTLRSGGPGSGLYRSTDAGKTWQRLTDPALHNGLPAGPINRVGVSVCASDPRVVYAFVPVKHGMLYRTTDGGTHWELRSADQDVNFRPFYFSQVRCDPSDPKRLYSMAGPLLVSTDGGKTFKDAGGGGDNHDLWIDPRDPQRLLNGSDLGFELSVDRGATWNFINVVPFDQIYRVGYDMAQPYHVMGGMQDHEVWWGPSDKWSRQDGVSDGDWLNISDWGDGQYAMADPRDPDVVYEDTHFGDLVRANLKTGERRYISPQPIINFGTGAGTYTYRFNWSAPLLLSHFDPSTIYFGGNVLFRSTDEGATWSVLGGDQTHCDPSQLGRSGGPITFDNTNAESYCTIYTIAEDAKDPNVVWTGTDNGHLDVTRDGGKTWSDVIGNVPGLAPNARVAAIAASPTQPGVAYAAFDRHQFDDYRAYAYVTRDYGATWSSIANGFRAYVHVVREDPRNPDVLYAGAEDGVYVSLDRGAHWSDLRLGIPHVPVYDVQIQPRDNDLIVGTHGRGFYILDDLTPLQQLAAAKSAPAYLFAPMPAYRFARGFYTQHGRGAFVADAKEYGATITYYLAGAPAAPHATGTRVTFDVLDANGTAIAHFARSGHAGLNRTSWDLTTLPPSGASTVQDARATYIFYSLRLQGPQVVPGTYTLRMTVGDRSYAQPVTVQMDPRHPVAQADLVAQQQALNVLLGAQEDAEIELNEIDGLQTQIEKLLAAHPNAGLTASLQGLSNSLRERAAQLRNTDRSGYRDPARLTEQIAYLRDVIGQYDGAPTAAQTELIARYVAQATAEKIAFQTFVGAALPALNARLHDAGLAPLTVRITPVRQTRGGPPPD